MITVEKLNIYIEDQHILSDVSFHIWPGEYVWLIGPNGAWKSTLMKSICWIKKPSSGLIHIASNCRIAYIPQGQLISGVIPISVLEVLMMSGVNVRATLESCVKKVWLEISILKRNYHQLSGWQKQRVIIARALCSSPNTLLFDEPFTGVDFETKLKVYNLLAELNLREWITILFVSHEIDQIIEKCHRVLCLDKHMHTGCHPLDFARWINSDCPVLNTWSSVVAVHHNHDNPPCSC